MNQSCVNDNDFFSSLATDGQLSVDVIEAPREIMVRAAMAGTRAEDIDVHATQDTLTIRGVRHHGHKHTSSHTIHVQECYWGNFSRSIVLPCHVRPEETKAHLKNGILTVSMKKARPVSPVSVIDLDE